MKTDHILFRKSSSYFKTSFKTRFGLRGVNVPLEQLDTMWTL